MPYAALRDFDAYFEAAGTGEPVVYVHGGWASLGRTLYDPHEYEWTWEHELAADVHLVTYDRRGCRRSTLPRSGGGFDPLSQADDLAEILDLIELRSAHLIGSSSGGPIALAFAATRPEATRSLVLQGTAADLFPNDDRDTRRIRQLLRQLDELGPRGAFERRPKGIEVWIETMWRVREAKRHGTLAAHRAEEARLAQRAASLPLTDRARWYAAELANIRAYMEFDLAPLIRRVRAPTLIAHGERDEIVPVEWARSLARMLAQARLLLVPEGGHGLLARHADVRREVVEFIRTAAGDPPHAASIP